MTVPYCSACGTPVPDLEANHHVCVPDGKGGFTKTTRDDAAKARIRADAEGLELADAFALNVADAAAAAQAASTVKP